MAQPTTRPSADIEDGDKIEPSLAGQDASGIGNPDVIWLNYGEVLKAVGSDRTAVLAVSRARPVLGALPSEEPFGTHEPRDMIATAGTAHDVSQPRAAIGLSTARKLEPNAPAQLHGFRFASGSADAGVRPSRNSHSARPGELRTTRLLYTRRSSARSGHTSGRHFGEDAQRFF